MHNGFIYYFFILSIPLFLIILVFFTHENILLVLSMCATLPLIPLYFIYDFEKTIYDKKERKNSEKIKLYESQTKYYNEVTELYDRDIIKYNSEIRWLKEIGNIIFLEDNYNQIIAQIGLFITEIRNIKNLSNDDKFRCATLSLKYDYTSDYSILEKTTLTAAEIKTIYENYVNKENINKAENYLKKIGSNRLNYILDLLKEVEKIQKAKLTSNEKMAKIKYILWSQHSSSQKLWIGGILGTLFGLLIFGTGGIGIVGLGSAIGIWGFLAGTTGGILISSLIQNFENTKDK